MNFVRKNILRLPALLIIGFIWLLSSQSTLPHLKGALGWDKLQHSIAYFALAAAVGFWISQAFWKRRPVLALLITASAASVYGAVDEFHQYFVPGRSCDIWDWIADTVGAILGALTTMVFMLKFRFDILRSKK